MLDYKSKYLKYKKKYLQLNRQKGGVNNMESYLNQPLQKLELNSPIPLPNLESNQELQRLELNQPLQIRQLQLENQDSHLSKPTVTNTTLIIQAHGTIDKGPFELKQNYKIITISNVGNKCPVFAAQISLEITDFYKAGNTIFRSSDNSLEITTNGQKLEDKLNIIVDRENAENIDGKQISRFHFKNHIGSDTTRVLVNDNHLQFTGGPCDGKNNCHITIINKDNKITTTRISETRTIYLSDLLTEYGPGTYIIVACRGIDAIPKLDKLIRQTSL